MYPKNTTFERRPVVEVPVEVMTFEVDPEVIDAATAAFSPLPTAFKVKADDLRHKIMIRMAATVSTIPPTTPDKMVNRERVSK